ncbi:unnamed protein product [Callosobruchus maculatus]|uniref:Uncharacterized protein n=1 Tax=Callosobruchus maculatus TaxID=64391 RepID=A0A653CIN5_CALMS|nr:unnamed protein product [Callosobruchus maculatus]
MTPVARIGLAIGYWEPMAMTDVARSPGCMVNLGGFTINLGKMGMGTARKDDKQVSGAFYHVHWYKYPLTYWLKSSPPSGACRAAIWISDTCLKSTRHGGTAP